MPELTPNKTTNLDGYGNDALAWERAHKALAIGSTGPDITHFLGTIGQDGQPYVAGVGCSWYDGDLYFTSSLNARKARNVLANPTCTIAVKVNKLDITLRGTAAPVTDMATLEQIARIYRDGGWPAEVKDDALTAPFSAPSAGPPPWHVFRFTIDSVVAVAGEEPYGATRWDFAR